MKSKSQATDFADLVGQLNAGVFEQQVNRALSDLAANCVTHSKKGSVTLTFNMKQIGESNQVHLTHTIKSVVPTMRGRITEEHATDTPLHVGKGGTLTLFPNDQTQMELGAGAATGRTDGERA
jgi:hypothetical protein